MHNGSQWNRDLDNPANNAFVNAFHETYGRYPTLYASQGYDAARLIGSALAAVGGNVNDADGFRNALRQAKFDSVRGAFRFGPNQHPIQDLYVREVIKDDSGNYTNRTVKKVFTDHADAYAKDCKM